MDPLAEVGIEIETVELENIRSCQRWSSVSEEMTAAQYWNNLPELLDSCNADALLFGGDMIDFCSSSNVEILKQGLDKLVTPYLYVRADHDSAPYHCDKLAEAFCNSLHATIDGNAEVQWMEFPELRIIGLNNNTSQISEAGATQMAELLLIEKPTILLTHVPFDSVLDTSLQEASKTVWQNRALVWGKDCYYQPDKNTEKLMNMIYDMNSPIKEILCGHLHFTWDGQTTDHTHEHVFSPAFEEKIGVITVKGSY